MAVEFEPQNMNPTPECTSLKTSAVDDPRWNTQSPEIANPLCKGTWWRFWPTITWEINIPNGKDGPPPLAFQGFTLFWPPTCTMNLRIS
ncbi:hypothetical protein VMCG_08233 [Cytospora schulzeri]|uniref:Uncharacterized protein n=1 Tax=Cytospora schulzeri TaxID=448051 RepID=A0A423VSZ4_9PEZI|nr:hypothetical protein VMCG_08233 [Valsa malicola]